MTIDTLLRELIERWRYENVELLPPASAETVADFEAKYQVQCPEDFAAYLTTVGGMPTRVMDEQMFHFSPINEIGPRESAQEFFVFADFLISSHDYGICLYGIRYGHVFLLGGAVAKKVAPTFTEFVDRYLHEHSSLF